MSHQETRCVELSLLVPGCQFAAIERTAVRQGLTVGRLLRRVIQGYLAGEAKMGELTESRQSGAASEVSDNRCSRENDGSSST